MSDVLERPTTEQPSTGASAEPTLRVRGPAYGVITECLRIQATRRPQSRVAHFFGASPLTTDARSWYRGALGEIHVAKVLKNLGPEWTVLHAVPIGAGTSDIDHVLIGPGGIFTINTKNHSGQKIWVGGEQLLVNGHRTNHIRDARFEARRASKILSAATVDPAVVVPVIAIVDPGSLTFGRNRPKDILVLSSSQLARTLLRRKRRLTDDAIRAYTDLAEQRGTWHTDSRVHDDTLRHEARFLRLQHEVAVARRRRTGWMLASLGLVSAAGALPALVGALAF
jgi:hypothetical protein